MIGILSHIIMANPEIIIGQVFNKLTVIRQVFSGVGKKPGKTFECLCECGQIVFLQPIPLSKAKSCGCEHYKRRPVVNLQGQVFFKLTVLCKKENIAAYEKLSWKCQCSCGNITYATTNSLIHGKHKSCGCLKKLPKISKDDLINKKFGRLTIVSQEFEEKSKIGITWNCLCDCGNTHLVTTYNLKSGKVKSCGCLHKENSANQFHKINQTRRDVIINPKLVIAKYVYTESYNDGDISFEKFLELSQLSCFYCGQEPSNKRIYHGRENNYSDAEKTFIYNGLDFKNDNPEKPYIHNLENVVPCCRLCNMSKTDMMYQNFIDMISKIYNLSVINKRKSLMIFPSDEDLFVEMISEGFIIDKSIGKNLYTKTNKGRGLYNRYWNYFDDDSLTFAKFYYLTQQNCYYCGNSGSNFITYEESGEKKQYLYTGLDRLDQSAGHSLNNIVPCCHTCNFAKQKQNAPEFLSWVARIAKNLNL